MATVGWPFLLRSMVVSDFQEEELTMAIRNILSIAFVRHLPVLVETKASNVDRGFAYSTLLVRWATCAKIGPASDFG